MNIIALKQGGRARAAASVLGLGLWVGVAGSAHALMVSMPTPQGAVDFDTAAFAAGLLAGPIGEFGCFTGGTLSACTPAALQAAVIGPDLGTGLTLGQGAEVTLALPVAGRVLAFWEAGDITLAGDAANTWVSVRTATGWTEAISLGAGHLAPVLNDTRPSGYGTNFGVIGVAEFGLAADASFDAVRLVAGSGIAAHFDLLAVAAVQAVPEPGTAALLALGLLGLLAMRRPQ
jgi:hypothetical protein